MTTKKALNGDGLQMSDSANFQKPGIRREKNVQMCNHSVSMFSFSFNSYDQILGSVCEQNGDLSHQYSEHPSCFGYISQGLSQYLCFQLLSWICVSTYRLHTRS